MIIGIVGLIASGKDTLASFFMESGFEHISLSDILRQEAKKRQLDSTRKTLQLFGTTIKQEQGEQVLAKLALERQSRPNLIITSIRHPAEVDFLRNQKQSFYLVAIKAEAKTRFLRARLRARPGDAQTFGQFQAQEARETGTSGGQQLAKTMQMADFSIDNNGDEQALISQAERLLNKLESQSGQKNA